MKQVTNTSREPQRVPLKDKIGLHELASGETADIDFDEEDERTKALLHTKVIVVVEAPKSSGKASRQSASSETPTA